MEFSEYFASRIEKRSIELCNEWLARLIAILPAEAGDAFPSRQLLEEIPAILQQIARYLRPEAIDEVQTASAVTERARALGALRFTQGASTHQILREYELLTEVLEEQLARCEAQAPMAPTATEMRGVTQRFHRIVRVLLRASVDAFITRYTERIDRQREKLLTFNRAVAHEIRNPLGVLEISSSLLRAEMTEADAAQVAGLIRNSVGKLVDTVRSLEMLSRLDNAATPRHEEVAVSMLAEEVAQQLTDLAAEREVAIQIAPELPVVHSDSHLLEMILTNLFANAIKYSDPGKAGRFARLDASTDEEGNVVLRVSDNGLGIPPEQRKAIFGRFFRGRPEDDARLAISGSGLGLSIVRDCVETLRGTIDLESEEGTGSAFTVRIPIETPD